MYVLIGRARAENHLVAPDASLDGNGVDGVLAPSFLVRRLDSYRIGPDSRGGPLREERTLLTKHPPSRNRVHRRVPIDIAVVDPFEWPVAVRTPGVVALGVQELVSTRKIAHELQHVRPKNMFPVRAGNENAANSRCKLVQLPCSRVQEGLEIGRFSWTRI